MCFVDDCLINMIVDKIQHSYLYCELLQSCYSYSLPHIRTVLCTQQLRYQQRLIKYITFTSGTYNVLKYISTLSSRQKGERGCLPPSYLNKGDSVNKFDCFSWKKSRPAKKIPACILFSFSKYCIVFQQSTVTVDVCIIRDFHQ